MNRFIQENKRFIMACAYRSVGHFVTESDDEWSIAMIAFHEAVMNYEPAKGDFKALAATVIRRRLVDYQRSEARYSQEISVEPYTMDGDVDDEDPSALQLEIRQKEAEISDMSSGGSPGGSAVRDEIEAVQELLGEYGFSFFDLADCSPKAEKTKKRCAEAVIALLEDPELFRKMRSSKTLPIKEIVKASGVPKKILERHRKYIIAAAEILNGEYPLLAEYMSYIRKALSP
ncbi:MAG: RNA polymerase subunit sigma [Blautia sp.]|nr:RNA polymerase subunit sigma [Blautia sp.]